MSFVITCGCDVASSFVALRQQTLHLGENKCSFPKILYFLFNLAVIFGFLVSFYLRLLLFGLLASLLCLALLTYDIRLCYWSVSSLKHAEYSSCKLHCIK